MKVKLLLENWRQFLKEEQGPQTLAHLVGQAGSGKTYFIENTLLKKYPEIVAKDLDDFDDEADAVVASGSGDKSWRASGRPEDIDQELAKKHFDEVQKLVDEFLSQNSDKKVFLAGMSVFPWVEGENELNLGNPKFKFYLDIDPKVSAERRIERDVKKGLYGKEKLSDEEFEENLEADLEHATAEKSQLLSAGYEPTTPEEIVKAVDGAMQEDESETPA